MRIPDETHLAEDLRVHALLADFELEDVWQPPGVVGAADDFDLLVDRIRSGAPIAGGNAAARFLFAARRALGRVLRLDDDAKPAGDAAALPIPGEDALTIAARLPPDLRGTVDRSGVGGSPFVPVYRTPREFAAEISNRTVHGVLHLSWNPIGGDQYQGRLAIYVRPRGLLGRAYMAFIKPFRYLVVYPALEKQMAREWAELTGGR